MWWFLIIPVVLVVLTALVFAFLKSPTAVGHVSEMIVRTKLRMHSEKSEKVLSNLYVPKPEGGTSEIDILFITRKGLIVIENKHYAGYIFGTDTDLHWTVTYKHQTKSGKNQVKKISFYNPVLQNRTHIKCLETYLSQNIKTYSLVTFGNPSRLMNITVKAHDVFICNHYGIADYLKNVRNDPDALSDEQIQELYKRLLPLKTKDAEVKQQHVQEINDKFNQTNTCPLCGSPLVLRTSKRGDHAGSQFYGCSNYPKCRYTKKL